MQVKKINTEQEVTSKHSFRPIEFDEFVGQQSSKKLLFSAIESAKKRNDSIGHILFSWSSWYWKTTLANIVAHKMWTQIKVVTWYAIQKPADIISVLNSLEFGDILFIDEIHRIRPNIEEILYIAMEDFAIDMVMPKGWSVRVPLKKFCLIWATTKLESLSEPLKNRFIYRIHFQDYTAAEKLTIVERYLRVYEIKGPTKVVDQINESVTSVPREIHNFCVTLRDYLISEHGSTDLDESKWNNFRKWADVHKDWLWTLHKRYLDILALYPWKAVWLKTISLRLGINEQAVEDDIEPLLLKLGKIDKTSRGRILL